MEELIKIIQQKKDEVIRMDADTRCINIFLLALDFCLTSAKNIYENSIPGERTTGKI
jgi:hypothetical protein